MTRTPTSLADSAAQSPSARIEAQRLSDLTPEQWKSGIAAWLGWLFDGLDMHLYVLVAAPFVAELLGITNQKHEDVGYYSSLIQAAFLIGWALGGGFFGRIADRIGRSRALMATILTYALFTGVSFFAQTWWQSMIFRFLAALGIGGEWAVGASLLSETWPVRWRPWMAAVLQTGVNLGVMLASLANFLLAAYPHRTIFLVGVLPALLVLWIRRAVPEPEEWEQARADSTAETPRFVELFQGSVRRTTVLTILVCSLSLSAHWAFMFWYAQHLRNLPEVSQWTEAEKGQLVSKALWLLMVASITGNFLAAALARAIRYRRAITLICFLYCLAVVGTYGVARQHSQMWIGLGAIGLCQGVFALFTMYLPPLFPTLLRTTGAGFCYNIGRIAAGMATVFFGLSTKVGDYRTAILYSGLLFLPAAALAWLLPDAPEERGAGQGEGANMMSPRDSNDFSLAAVGSPRHSYRALENWAQLPAGYSWSEVPAVAVDGLERVYVFNRGEHPVIVFAADGTFLDSWGEGVFARPHGITVDSDDNVWCTDDLDHTVRKFTPQGELLLTLGTSGRPSDTGATSVDYRTIERIGPPFHFPTNLALAPDGSIYVTDGYGNARVHKFAADGRLLLSWGAPGNGPGQFNVPHGIAIDAEGIVFVADRENSRLQLFSSEGKFVDEWTDIARPCQVFIDPGGDVFVAELGYRAGMWPGIEPPRAGATGGRVSIFNRQGELKSRFGGGDNPCAAGDFFAPHDICVDPRGDVYVSEVTWSAGGKRGLVPADCHALQKFVRCG